MATAKASERYYPNLKGMAPYHVELDHYQLRKMIYDLIDVKVDVLDKTLADNWRVDRDLAVGRPLVVIARQNVVGGWAIQWATNQDGSLKFKGTNLVTVDTTANTYTGYLFIGLSPTEALLVAYVTGGNLS